MPLSYFIAQCCEECLNVDAPCVFEGLTVAAHQKWKTDECTTCTCFAGKVKCSTQRCRFATDLCLYKH